MKKVLSLVLAIVMMASVLVVSTAAADVNLDNTIAVGASATADALSNAAALNGLAVAGTDKLTFTNVLGTTSKVGSTGTPVSFYVDLATLLPGYSPKAVNGLTGNGDFVTAAVTKGYSIVSMATAIDATVDATNKTMLVTLTPVAGSATGGVVTITFTFNTWDSAAKVYAKSYKTASFTYDVPEVANLAPQSDGKGGYYYLATVGSTLTAAQIKQAKGNMLIWNNMDAVNNIAVTFPKVANLTPVDLGLKVTNAYTGIDAPAGTMKVITFNNKFALADAAMVTYSMDYDFKNINGTDLNVYFVEDVEGASTTVKGAKVTFVQKGIYALTAAGQPTVTFNLLDNKLGTYVITSKTLESAGTTASSSTVGNVNTGADSVVNVAIVFAVLALAAAGFVAVKKVK